MGIFKNIKWQSSLTTIIFSICGIILGFLGDTILYTSAKIISDTFVNLLKLISLPLVFFSIISTFGGLSSFIQIRSFGLEVLKYTVLTTITAASVALSCYHLFNPVNLQNISSFTHVTKNSINNIDHTQQSYWSFFLDNIPNNMIEPFISNNVIGVLFLSLLISAALLRLPLERKKVSLQLFKDFFHILLTIANFLMQLMPIVIGAFMIIIVRDFKVGLEFSGLILYISCIISANLIQAFVILPLFLRWNQINPIKLAKAMWPALTVAFFSKSSAAALPSALRCAEESAGLRKDISRFSFPLCATINMNACAGFILISVLFVSEMNGIKFTSVDYVSWVFISSLAALGNAAVPMGCYFLASSFLASQNVPLSIMGAILPLYAFLDMLETAINVWSDSCVTAIVNKKLQNN